MFTQCSVSLGGNGSFPKLSLLCIVPSFRWTMNSVPSLFAMPRPIFTASSFRGVTLDGFLPPSRLTAHPSSWGTTHTLRFFVIATSSQLDQNCLMPLNPDPILVRVFRLIPDTVYRSINLCMSKYIIARMFYLGKVGGSYCVAPALQALHKVQSTAAIQLVTGTHSRGQWAACSRLLTVPGAPSNEGRGAE
jgi:hypothetical protein